MTISLSGVRFAAALAAGLWLYSFQPTSAAPLDGLRQQAANGDANSQARLGLALASGFGAPKDEAQALIWFRRAAEQGNGIAKLNLGQFYAEGLGGLPKDDSQAVAWFREAAEQGEPKSRAELKKWYFDGRMTPVRDGQGATWWNALAEQACKETETFSQMRRRAEAGDPDAQTALGLLYVTGTGVAKNREAATDWFIRAAKKGQVEAACLAAAIATANTGLKVPTDNASAVEACLVAAKAGFADAQFILSTFYEMGRGVPTDKVQSANWVLKAAEQGRADAQESLAYRYEKGDGVPQDKSLANRWRILAALQFRPTTLLSLQIELATDKGPQFVNQLPERMQDVQALGNLAVEHSWDGERDLLPNLWASPVNQAQQREIDKEIGKMLNKALRPLEQGQDAKTP